MWILLIFLSFLITAKGSGPKQQYFRVKPQDREAVEGETVEFQCHVENVAGDVQWSKDGFLLGFERSIPGYPRYFMVLNTVQGVYNLRIENVRLEDEAEFQCQVGPSKNQKPIRAAARLTVVIPPKNMTINGLPDGEEVMVRESQRLVLTCKTRGSKPPVEMKWYRRSVELVPEATKVSVTIDEGKGFTTSSSLTLYPKLEHSGTTYTCEAFHPALDKPLRATIAVGVLFPPSPPIIQGYQDDDVVQIGDMVVLICISRGGKPAPRIIWYRNDVLVDISHSSTGYETTNTFTFTAGIEDNNVVFRCEVSNALTKEPMKKSVTIRVLFGPKNLTISGPSEARRGETIVLSCQSDFSNPPAQLSWVVDNNIVKSTEIETYQTPDGWMTSSNLSITITRQDVTTKIISCYASAIPLRAPVSKTHTVVVKYPPESPTILGYEELSALKEGDLQRLTCVVLGGNPPANLKWYKGEREISAPVTISGSGVSSELVFRIDASDNGISYTCKAFSPAITHPLETSVTLNVYFSSEKVILSVVPQIPKEGQTVTITCQTGSSNPKPEIIWLRNNKLEEQHYEEIHNASHGGLSVKSGIVFVARPSDDGVRFICRTKSDVFPDITEAQIILRILYKPKFSSIVQKRDLMEGDSTEINLAAIGNPDVISYRWYKEGAPVPVKSSEDKSTKNSKETRLRVTSLGPVLYIRSASRYDSSTYTCEARNEEGSSNATVILNVRYPAVIINISVPIEAKEKDNVTLECHFDGNPLPENTISWKKDGLPITQYFLEGKKSYLIIESITRNEAGEYHCIANNGMGKESVQTTTISVLHRPVIRRSQMKSKVASDLKDTAKFRCISDSYSNTSINWSYKQQLLERSPKYEIRNSARNSTWDSTLLVKHLEESDFGIYDCIAVNALGKDVFQFLLVKRGPPEPPIELQIVNVSNNYIFIIWKPGFDGGYVSSFRIRYRQLGVEAYYFQDAVAMRHNHKIVDLKAGTEYYIAVSAWNDLGHSNFTSEIKVSTTEIAVMDSTQASPGKKIKSITSNSKWWWICVTAVGTVFVLVNVIVVICLIHKGKCCARSIGGVSCSPGQSCVHDIDKQVRYTVGGKSFYITGEKLDVAHEHIMMENFKNRDEKTYVTVDIVGKKLNLQPSNLRRNTNEDYGLERFEELINKPSNNEFPDILKRISCDASAFKDEKISNENNQSPFSKSKNCLSSSTRSLNSDASSHSEHNISLPMTSTSSCDLRIRHILFEPEQPSLKPFMEYLDS